MHLFGIAGIVIFGVGALLDLYMLILKVLGQDIWGRPLLLLGVLLTLGGIQLITTGILTKFITRTYYESQKKRPYRVKNVSVGAKKEQEAAVSRS